MDIVEFLSESLPTMGIEVIASLGQLLVAVVLFIVFWIFGSFFGSLLARGVNALKVDSLLTKLEINKIFERAGSKLNTGLFLGGLLKWFLIIAGLLAASDYLGLYQVSGFLESVLFYVPNIIVAAIILIAGVILADFVAKVVASSIAAAGLKSAPFVSKVARWAIFIFSFIAALDQLQIAQTFINTLYIGLVAMLSIAGGLAFGLGGKEHASEFIAKVKRDISEKE